jgi:hypothetical protein
MRTQIEDRPRPATYPLLERPAERASDLPVTMEDAREIFNQMRNDPANKVAVCFIFGEMEFFVGDYLTVF